MREGDKSEKETLKCKHALTGCWCVITVLNVHALADDRSGNKKDNFYEELESVFDLFPKDHIQLLVLDFSAEVGRKNIFKLRIENKSLHEINDDKY
jgi:hypothetical protein